MSNNLTTLECRILTLAGSGHANKQIAFRLGIAEKTVKNHLTIIFDRLHAQNRTDAVSRALRMGYVRLEEIV